jgi:hypothetical protein
VLFVADDLLVSPGTDELFSVHFIEGFALGVQRRRRVAGPEELVAEGAGVDGAQESGGRGADGIIA